MSLVETTMAVTLVTFRYTSHYDSQWKGLLVPSAMLPVFFVIEFLWRNCYSFS